MRVKIHLNKHESIEEAEELLLKALKAKKKAKEKHSEEFSDPAIQAIVVKLRAIYKDNYNEMLKEIEELLND